jgi:hypothetical protein
MTHCCPLNADVAMHAISVPALMALLMYANKHNIIQILETFYYIIQCTRSNGKKEIVVDQGVIKRWINISETNKKRSTQTAANMGTKAPRTVQLLLQLSSFAVFA